MVTLKDIAFAHDRIREFIHRTPILTNKSFNELNPTYIKETIKPKKIEKTRNIKQTKSERGEIKWN